MSGDRDAEVTTQPLAQVPVIEATHDDRGDPQLYRMANGRNRDEAPAEHHRTAVLRTQIGGFEWLIGRRRGAHEPAEGLPADPEDPLDEGAARLDDDALAVEHLDDPTLQITRHFHRDRGLS